MVTDIAIMASGGWMVDTDGAMLPAAGAVYDHVRAAVVAGRMQVVGLCGAQGAGKSSVAASVAARLRRDGLVVAVLSLDDLYLTRTARLALARAVHPLLAVRGVPGTHDPALGERLLEGLARPGATAVPRFDKARDTRAPRAAWAVVAGPCDVVLFEGWCVGARAQGAAALVTPVNRLEREADADGRWRGFVDAQLAGPYARLFGRLDRLVLLAAPDFATVIGWRQQQEAALRAGLAAGRQGRLRAMDDAAVERFVRHYERLTRFILAEMPARADLVLRLDGARRVVGQSGRTA